jgi:hypothetical protein
MKNEHVISGLIAKRSELAGQIETLQRQIRDLVAALGHIDASIRLFDPDADLQDMKPRLPRHMARLILDALRQSTTPLPVYDLTLIVLSGRGLNPDDKPFVRVLSRRVGACLGNLRKRGLVMMTRPPGSLGLWEIVR